MFLTLWKSNAFLIMFFLLWLALLADGFAQKSRLLETNMFLKLAMFFLKESCDLIGMCIKRISCSKYADFHKHCDYM